MHIMYKLQTESMITVFYEVVKMDSEIITSSHISFSDEEEMVFIGLCPDPDSATGIYTAVYGDLHIYNEN